MQLVELDYWWQELILDCPPACAAPTAQVTVTQPQGYVQQLVPKQVSVDDGQARIRILYPLIDDGRYDASHGTWNGAWEMGCYRFDVTLTDGSGAVVRDQLELDPHDFFPHDRMPIAVDARCQFIECAARQPIHINEDHSSFLVRIRRHRVNRCTVEVDVTEREGDTPLAGPWRFQLGHQFKEHGFATDDWPTGEYWIRLRSVVDGRPVGPYCVRKFWKQVSPEAPPPEVIELRGCPSVMVDDYILAEAEGVQFVPDPMEKPTAAPMLQSDRPYEYDVLKPESLTYNDRKQRFEFTYGNWHTSIERQHLRETCADLKMLLISPDGEHWEKPTLGLVDYDGTRDNNILTDQGDAEKERIKQHDIECAKFEFYDPQRDGPIDLANVFVASGKRHHLPFECRSLQNRSGADMLANAERGQQEGLRADGLGVLPTKDEPAGDDNTFRPRGGEFWPMAKRGDHYLVLTREPVLYLGVGMDLMHSSEIIHAHIEQIDPPRLLWYFRPSAPAYPPHGATYDNMHLCLRCLGVMWTDDGSTYHRQFVLASDSHDVIGTQFYSMGLLHDANDTPAGRATLDIIAPATNDTHAVDKSPLHLGTALIHWGIEQQQAPELIWSRDLLNFHRFQQTRRPLIERGPGGSHDAGMVRDHYRYYRHDRDGVDYWWYPYTAVNTRHNGYAVLAKFTSIDELRKAFPNHADAPYSSTWEAYFCDGKQTRYLPSMARCRAGRVAHAEPVEETATLTTRPVRVDGGSLAINAATDFDGSIDIVIRDRDGKQLYKSDPAYQGDQIDAVIADLSGWRDQTVTVQFTLHKARLYAFTIA